MRPLISKHTADHQTLNEAIQSALIGRLAGNNQYTEEEIDLVSALSSRLFPRDFTLSEEHTKQLRAMAALSQCEVKGLSQIKSHRPVIGPVIVAAKRVIWRVLSLVLKDTFAGIQEYNSWMVYSHAKLMVELEELRKTQ